MKKINLLILIMMLFSFIVENIVHTQISHAETTKIELMNEDNLKLDYDYKMKDDSIQWRIGFERNSHSENLLQRLKIKVTDEKNDTIDYPVIENIKESKGWLVEEKFTEKMEGQIVLDLPKSSDVLNLHVEMDQKGTAEDAEVKEDILELEKPFKLEAKKTQKSQTQGSSSKEEVTSSSSTTTKESAGFIGPKLTAQSTLRSGGMTSAYQNQYVNKQPIYTESPQEGKYPANSWSPNGQSETIRNHQGGNSADSATSWDGLTSWDVSQDDRSKSYINYGDDSSNPNLAIRKLAYSTDKEDEFNIRLNVRGNTTYKPGVDIVFLIDHTGTMSAETNRVSRRDRANAALKTMINQLKLSKIDENIRVGAYFFSSGQFEKGFSAPYNYDLSSNTTTWDTIVKNHKLIPPEGPTFTQRGLVQAKGIFDRGNSDAKGRKKLLFVLTDGAPNSSYLPDPYNRVATRNDAIYPDKVHVENWLMTDDPTQERPNGYKAANGSSLAATANKTKFDSPLYYDALPISTHLSTTNSTAYDLKQEGIEIHTVTAGMSRNSSSDHPVSELQKGLSRMATQRANTSGNDSSDYFFKSVTDTENLTEGIKEWYDTVISTINKGVITDPIGDMFELVSGPTKKTYDRDGNQITLDPQPNGPIVNNYNEIVVTNLSLKQGEQLQIDYRVRLKTNDSRFKKGVWYQTNGPTTLKPTPERTTDVLNFGVPSVRIKADEIISIPVKKVWANDKVNNVEDYWKRRESVTVELQKQNGSTWTKIGQEKVLNEANNWSSSFTNIADIPGSRYRVVEKSVPAGHSVSYNLTDFTKDELGGRTVEVTNTLKKTNFQFDKFKNDGQTPFPTSGSRPIFEVEDAKSHKKISNISPNLAGTVTFENLPVGMYVVSETDVPTGYEKMTEFIFTIEENANGDLVTKVGNSTARHTVTNKLKGFSLELTKKDTTGTELSGAAFRLRGMDGLSYDQTVDMGPKFTFNQLKPGRYLLTEIMAPSGYDGLDKDIEITISELGIVTIEDHDSVEGAGSITPEGNKIMLEVKNKKLMGSAPSTGGKGRNKLMIVSASLVGVSSIVGLLYFFLNRKNW